MKVFWILTLLLIAGCARPAPDSLQRFSGLVIDTDTTWSGSILIDGQVEVLRDATLTIAPGTDIAFVYRDDNRDGLGDGTLIVKGELKAIGTAAQPIRFRSARPDPQPGDWLEIAVDFSRQVHFRHCEFRDSAYTLHAHFTRGIIEDCHIHHNIDGCRIGQASFILRHNLVEQNSGKGINFRNSRVQVHDNLIRDNQSGIFLFENDQPFSITRNNFSNNREHLRLGDFYVNDVHLEGNWWGTAELERIAPYIYDRRVDPEIGAVTLVPASAALSGVGPRRPFSFEQVWAYETAGFVDATPLLAGGLALYPGWDGKLHALKSDGSPAWVAQLGDIADATPAADGARLFVQTWGRQVLALALDDGREEWRFTYPPSPADDHRQGGLVLVDGQLLVPGWNGTLYALASETGRVLWSYAAGSPLRAAPLVAQQQIYLPDSGGTLHALSLQGELRWKKSFSGPLLTTPAETEQGAVQLDKNGTLTAVTGTGETLWQLVLDEPCFYSAPVLADGVIVLGTAAGAVYAVAVDTGVQLWSRQTAGAVYATPALWAGRVLVGDNAGRFFAFSLASGELLAEEQFLEPIQSRATPFGGLVLIAGRDKAVRALRMLE